MKKLLLLFAVMLSTVGAWAQVYQKVPHTKWTVTAPNQSATSGNEGGVAFIKDENPSTFYHSNWGGDQLGQKGLQGFLIDMAEEMTNFTAENVKTQAATSILAQANERPQTILQLLQ